MNLSQLESTFDKMDLVDLKAVAPMVAQKIAEREVAEKDAMKAELAALAQSKGFDMSDLFGDAPAAKKERKPVAPKYRNPADGSQTWTGRGRKPKWVTEALDAGGNMDDFLIGD